MKNETSINLNRRVILLISLFLYSSNSFCQCTLFQENCGRATVNTITSYTGFTNSSGATITGTGSVAKTILTTAISTNLSGNANGNSTGASGSTIDSNLVKLTASQTWIISNINTTSYTLSKLIFNVRKSSGVSFNYSDLRVELQVGSAGWVAYTTASTPALVPAHAECNTCWDYWTFNIPATISGSSSSNSNFQIRFTNITGSARFFEIDDVVLTGTATGSLTAGSIGSNQTICYNATPATLTNVSAPTGGSSYTYQWQSSANNSLWSSISGATSSTYSPGALTSNTYYRRAETSCGSTVYTTSILITITPLASITTQPSNQTACLGTAATLSVTATGTGLTYQWRKTGVAISGATSSSYTISSVVASDAANYDVIITTSSCPVTSNTASLTVNTSNQWNGSVSNVWSNASNWSCGIIPNSNLDAVIASTATLPTISSTATVKNLTINASATLTNAATGTLNIYGNWINNGTFTDNSIYSNTGVVNFIGASAQTITGTTTFSNVTINNTSGVTLNTTSTINGILTLTAGNFTTGGFLSQNLYNGSIAGTGTGTTTGSIRFFKTIWGDRYHYLSSPITGKTAADWNDNVIIKFGTYSNLYYYNETSLDTNRQVGWTPITTTATTLDDVKGYALYFPRWAYNTTLDVSGSYTHSATFTSATLTNTPSTTPIAKPSSDGWNLVGNPYPSTLDWTIASGWAKPASLNDAIYMWDGRTNRYTSYVSGIGTNGGTQYIGSMQGFFVNMAAGGTGTLGVNNNARITSTLIDVLRLEKPMNILSLSLSIDTLHDETIIRFAENATDTFDGKLDAYKMNNGGNTPSLSSITSSENYSINSLPSNLSKKSIPLQLNIAVEGSYNITADLSNFNTIDSIILEDRLLGIFQDLRHHSTYATTLSKGTSSGRFFINYANRQNMVTDNVTSITNRTEIEINTYQQNVDILFQNENVKSADIAVFDAVGKKVYTLENATINGGKTSFSLHNLEGIFIVKVKTLTDAKAKQIFIQP